MSQMPKILGIIFVFLVVAQTALFLGVNFYGEKALAEPDGAKWTMPDPEIKLFKNFKFTEPTCVTDQKGKKTCSVPWIGEYIVGIYKYAIGIVGILAAVVMMFGGVRWIMAGGNASAIGEAKAWIAAALTGLVLALASYTILYYINPSLTQPTPIKVASVIEAKTGCCQYKNGGGGTVEKNNCPNEKGIFLEGQVWDPVEKKCSENVFCYYCTYYGTVNCVCEKTTISKCEGYKKNSNYKNVAWGQNKAEICQETYCLEANIGVGANAFSYQCIAKPKDECVDTSGYWDMKYYNSKKECEEPKGCCLYDWDDGANEWEACKSNISREACKIFSKHARGTFKFQEGGAGCYDQNILGVNYICR